MTSAAIQHEPERRRRPCENRCGVVLVCLTLAGFVLPSIATTYYVDAVSGDDNHPGTATNLAWRSVAAVSLLTFQPGDQVLFRRNQSFAHDGPLILRGSGNEDHPIRVGAYGEGATPVFENITGTLYSGVILVGYFHNDVSSRFAARIGPVFFDHNTFIKTTESTAGFVIGFAVEPEAATIFLRNNIWSVRNLNVWSWQAAGVLVDQNLYDLHGVSWFNFPAEPTALFVEPGFVDAGAQVFHLREDSPARDSAYDLGYGSDYRGVPVPQGSAPDRGAYEFMQVPTPRILAADHRPDATLVLSWTATSRMVYAIAGASALDDGLSGWDGLFGLTDLPGPVVDPWVLSVTSALPVNASCFFYTVTAEVAEAD